MKSETLTQTLDQSVLTDHHKRQTPDEIFQTLAAKADEVRTAGEKAVIIYDLDATLFDNRHRIIAILANTLNTEKGHALPDDIREAVQSITIDDIHYLLSDTFRSKGITDEAVIQWFQDEWFKRFFTNDYVVFDVPTNGAPDYVEQLKQRGATTVYLTGRDTPGMREGTLASLEEHNFPMPDEENVFLITKPTFEQPDTDYKQEAISQIKEIGTVIGVLDNEPKPMNILARAFPSALAVFMDTMHSPDLEPVDETIVVMKDFVLND